MIKHKLRKCQLGQNGIPVKQTSMWDTDVPNFNNPYVTKPLAEDDWHHSVDNIPFPGEGMTSLNPKNSKYFSQEELLNPSEEETSGNTQSAGDSKNKIKNKFNFNFNPAAYAKLQGLNGLLEGIGNIYQHNQQNQSRINMNPLSGLDFSNGRSEQSKYGYSFQKGGYTIQKGDNLTKLAKKFDIPLADLIAMNNIKNPDKIFTGNTLNIGPQNKGNISASVGFPASNRVKASATIGVPKNKAKVSATVGIPKPTFNAKSSATVGSTPWGGNERPIINSQKLANFSNKNNLSTTVDLNKQKNAIKPIKEKPNQQIALESGLIVDKRTGKMYTIKNGKYAEAPLNVLTGKNVNSNKVYNFNTNGNIPDYKKTTPIGDYMIKPNSDIYGYKGYDMIPLDINNKVTDLGVHTTYDPLNRNKFFGSKKPWISYGCINCENPTIDKIYNNFPSGDTLRVIDSKLNPEALAPYKGIFKSGGFIKKFEDGGWDEDDFLFGDDSNYKQNNAEETERITENQVIEEVTKKPKYDFNNDPLGLFGKRNKRVRSTSSEEVVDYEPAETNTTENQSFAFNYLQQKGMQPHQAAGVVGNFTQESNMNPGITNSIGAFGAGQWLGPRKKALFQYAKTTGKDPYHLQTQLDFTLHELSTTEKKAGNALGNTKTSAEAAKVFRKMYERPGESESNDKRRIQEARKMYPYQDGGMTGMMKGQMAIQAHFGNPSAQRMIKPIINPYIFTGNEVNSDNTPFGSKGTHFMGSYGNQVRPSIQNVNGSLKYMSNPPFNSKENMNFNTEDEAEYSAKYYKNVAPMMRKFKKGGQLSNWEIIEY